MEERWPREKGILFVEDESQLPLIEVEQNGKPMWKYVLFRNDRLLEEYADRGGKNGQRFYAVPKDYPINQAKGEVLILTASDQIAGIEYLTDIMPDIKFHIAANTQVSDKLHRLAEKKNVEIWPQIKQQDLDHLWVVCDFYLDINYYREIYNAVDSAHQRNLLIMGFEDTLHLKTLTADKCRFLSHDYKKLADVMMLGSKPYFYV